MLPEFEKKDIYRSVFLNEYGYYELRHKNTRQERNENFGEHKRRELQGFTHPGLPMLYEVVMDDESTTVIEEYIEGETPGNWDDYEDNDTIRVTSSRPNQYRASPEVFPWPVEEEYLSPWLRNE